MSRMQKVVINNRFGSFGLSDEAYEKMIEWGVPVCVRDPETTLYLPECKNDGEVILDRDPLGNYKHFSLIDDPTGVDKSIKFLSGNRYWDIWLRDSRSHPLLVRAVEELGEKANGLCACLKVVEIPSDVEWGITEHDGREQVAEKHRTWC